MAIQSTGKTESHYYLFKKSGLIPFIITFILSLVIASGLYAESKIPKVRHSVKPLDLTRTPTTRELMAAGQLGGQLYPTEDIEIEEGELQDNVSKKTAASALKKTFKTPEKQKRDSEINLSFGNAIDEWNRHEYKKAVKMFRKHTEDYPESPWVDESLLHVGCDARYNGRYTEAEEMFTTIIDRNKDSAHYGARMLRSKAKSRFAILKMLQGNFDESKKLFSELKKESPGWRHRTYASHWIQRMSRYKSGELALLNCGTEALALLLKKDGREPEAREIMSISPSSLKGHSMKELASIAEKYGYNVKGLKIALSDLQSVPVPAILQIDAKNEGDRGHYWVLENINGNELTLFDPQSGRRFNQGVEELSREWNGNAIVFSNDKNLPGIQLTEDEMKKHYGGCCGIPRLPDNTGNPGENAAAPPNQDDCFPGYGFPVWKVNMVSMNLYMTDIPLWYDSPIGPDVRIQLSYNSQSSVAQYEPFGNKWSFNYGSYIVEDTGGNVAIFMPDGRNDAYVPDGQGDYIKPFGIFNTLTKIANNHFELEFQDGTVYVYDIPQGTSSIQPFLVEIRDAYGQKLMFGYNTDVLLETITDARGKVTTLIDSNSDGLIDQVNDPFGRSAYFLYDQDNNLTRITDMGGYWAEFSYDTDINLAGVENQRGEWDIFIEPSDGIDVGARYPPPGASEMRENYRITITDPLGGREEYFYGDDNSSSWYVSPRDYVHYVSSVINNFFLASKTLYSVKQYADGEGKVASTHTPEGVITTFGYDDITGRRKFITDLHGHSNMSGFNNDGRMITYSDPKGNDTTFEYYPNDIDVWQIRYNLQSTPGNDDILLKTFTYNGTTHDVASITDRLGNITELNHNSYGQITSIVQAKNSSIEMTTELIYDAATHELTEIRKNGNSIASYTHDNVGRIKTFTNENGVTLTYDYNDLNQITKITYPDTKFETFTYSSCCPRMLDSRTDRAGLTTSYSYDALKRLKTVHGPNGVIRFEYDANGNNTKLIDPDEKETRFEYDLDNRLVRKIYADDKYIEYAYDTSNLLTKITNSRGTESNYSSYDANHNLLTIDYSDATPDVTVTYDDYDHPETMTGGTGLYQYGYDELNRLTSIDGPWNNDTVSYQYNELGDIRSLTPQGGQAITYNYDYDAGYADPDTGRLKNIQAGADTYTYGYTGVNSLIQSLTRPNGSVTLYEYNDLLKRLTTIDNQESTAQTVNKHVFDYNNFDLIDTETITTGTTLDAFNAGLKTYSYNNLNQILSSTNPSESFDYDDDGNMTQGYTPDGHQFAAAYDAENRLTTVAFNDGTNDYEIRYFYSGDGLLRRQEIWDDTLIPGTLAKQDEVRFIRSGLLAIQERDDTNTVIKEYTWGMDKGGGIEGLLKLNQSGQAYNYFYDGKGNVMVVADSSDAIAASYRYDAFGKPLKTAGTLNQPYRFSTKRYDEATGLSLYGYRFYNSAIGKWTARDPLGEAGGINLYGFVKNNPVNFVDPFGLDAINVHYVGYPVTYRGSKYRVGHGAVVAINPKTGNTRYYEYGRYGTDFGRAMERDVPPVKIGTNGKPTKESLNNLYDFISEKYGKNSPVWAEYYSDADYQKVIDYAEKIKNDPKRDPYSIWTNNCFHFAEDAIEAGR